MRHTIEVDAYPKLAIGREVVDSAIRILVAAGYSDQEILDLFHSVKAEDENDEKNAYEPIFEQEADGFDGFSLYDFEDRFADLEAVKALQRLAKRHENQWRYESEAEALRALSALEEAIPLYEEAQSWLRSNARDFGLSIGGIRDEWVLSASDDDLDNEDRFIFFDDWRYSGHFDWRSIETLARHYAARGDGEALASLSDRIGRSSVKLPIEITNTLQEATEQAEQFANFEDFVWSQRGLGEQMRSHLVDEYARIHQIEATYILDQWFEALAEQYPEIDVYKRSNRWRVQVG